MPTQLQAPRAQLSGGDAGGRRLTGRMVLACVVGFFGVIFAANFFLVRYALSSFGGVEVESAYKAGLAFSGDVEAAAAQAARHWQVAIEIARAGAPRTVTVDSRDAEGSPLAGLEAAVTFEHPADRRLDVTVALDESGAGRYVAELPAGTGQRIARLALSRGGEAVFRSENRVMLP